MCYLQYNAQKTQDYTSKYLQDMNCDGTNGTDNGLVEPRMSRESTVAGSTTNTLVISGKRRLSKEVKF